MNYKLTGPKPTWDQLCMCDMRTWTRTDLADVQYDPVQAYVKQSTTHRDYKAPRAPEIRRSDLGISNEPWEQSTCPFCGNPKPANHDCAAKVARCAGDLEVRTGENLYRTATPARTTIRRDDLEQSPCTNWAFANPPEHKYCSRCGGIVPCGGVPPPPKYQARFPWWKDSDDIYTTSVTHESFPAPRSKRRRWEIPYGARRAFYERMLTDLCLGEKLSEPATVAGQLGDAHTLYQDEYCKGRAPSVLRNRYARIATNRLPAYA